MDYILRLKVDNEFYNDYIDRFGKESVENYYKYFTNEEQIKRYTDNMIFWMERIPKQPKNKKEIINELFIRLEISTDKLRTLVERIKGTDFEKEVINNIYLKLPEYVNIFRPLRELALKHEIIKSKKRL
jgi:hypothetical protein